MTLMVRSVSEPAALVQPLQRLLGEMDSHLPVFNVRTMDEHVRSSVFGLMPLRIGASMAAVQGVIGLLLALMGLYAVVLYGVSQRIVKSASAWRLVRSRGTFCDWWCARG